MPKQEQQIEQQARELLANICWMNGCRETTRDEILSSRYPNDTRVKSGDAIEAIQQALSTRPSMDGVEDLVEELRLAQTDMGALSREKKGQMESATGFSADACSLLFGKAADVLASLPLKSDARTYRDGVEDAAKVAESWNPRRQDRVTETGIAEAIRSLVVQPSGSDQ